MDIHKYTAHLPDTQEIEQGKTTTFLVKNCNELYPITNDDL